MANKKLIMTTISASCFLIFAFLLLHLPAAAATDNHLASGLCEPRNLHGCRFYLSSFRNKVVADQTGFNFNPFYDQLEKQKLSDCCEELQGMDRECRCLAINDIAREHIKNQCDHDQQMGVVRAAINLAERCHLQPRFCLAFFTESRSIC